MVCCSHWKISKGVCCWYFGLSNRVSMNIFWLFLLGDRLIWLLFSKLGDFFLSSGHTANIVGEAILLSPFLSLDLVGLKPLTLGWWGKCSTTVLPTETKPSCNCLSAKNTLAYYNRSLQSQTFYEIVDRNLIKKIRLEIIGWKTFW